MIRNPRSEKEISDILGILETCFPKMKRGYFIKRILDDYNYRKRNTLILTKNNRIVSHAQIFIKKIWWEGAKITFIGLGFICTLPEFRNNGYSKILLNHILKEKGSNMLGLFTKIPQYYEKLGFFVIPRKRFVIKRADYIGAFNRKARIRTFNFDKDIIPVMSIYNSYFSRLSGPRVRDFRDWKSQLSYFDEDKKIFLVLETGEEIKAYIRCKRPKQQRKRIDIVEYASIGGNYLPDFILHLFKISHAQEVSGYKVFFEDSITDAYKAAEETDILMMLKCGKRFFNQAKGNDKICYLQADGF